MGYILKPVDLQELRVTIEFSIFKHRLQLEKENLMTDLTDAISNILKRYAQSEPRLIPGYSLKGKLRYFDIDYTPSAYYFVLTNSSSESERM